MTSSPELARAVVEALANHLTDVVLCPGSRNSPLSLALLAHPGIRVHTRIDERSAAFVALGMGRATGRHVAVVTTSGTAVPNCAPAVVEAAHSHTPLVVLSGDRPRALVGRGANQTIDQDGIFNVVDSVCIEELADVTKIPQAFEEPVVHLNVHLDTPLVDGMPQPVAVDPHQARLRGPATIRRTDHGQVRLDLSRRTLVIAGDEAWDVPGLEDVPTIAEPTAPAPYRPVHPLAAGVFTRAQLVDEAGEVATVVHTKPEQLVVVGHPTLHREVSALMADPEIELVVLSRTETLTNPAGRDCTSGSRVEATGQQDPTWLKICEAASELAAQAVRDVLAEEHGFTGLHVAAAVADSLAVGDTLLLGSSNPVRDAALVGMPFDGVRTVSPRGVAGIDGSISQAVGIALATQAAHPEEPSAPRTVALLGDVTFCHDVGGLFIGESPAPEHLTIVVANDDGGGIFETLELGQPAYRTAFERAFATPHGVDFAAACGAYGVAHERVGSIEELGAALDAAEAEGGFRVIEATTVRDTRRDLHEALKAKVAR